MTPTMQQRMLVARYYNNKDVRIESVVRPEIGDGEALVRVASCGICGSDVMEWFRVPKAPRILGHELAGVVVLSLSKRLRSGDRIVIRNQVPCGMCFACQAGHHSVCEHCAEIEPAGMSEYVRIPRNVVDGGVWPLPDDLPFRAATLAEPLACTLHSQKLMGIRGRRCLIVVGSGLFGLLHLLIARQAGVERIVVIEPNEYRRTAAAELGASAVLDAADGDLLSAVRTVNEGALADAAIVATGSPLGLDTAIRTVGRYGAVLLFGMPSPEAVPNLSLNRIFWRKELALVSSYGPGNVPFSEALRMMEKGLIPFDKLITHVLPFRDVQRGFELTREANRSLKVVLDMEGR